MWTLKASFSRAEAFLLLIESLRVTRPSLLGDRPRNSVAHSRALLVLLNGILALCNRRSESHLWIAKKHNDSWIEADLEVYSRLEEISGGYHSMAGRNFSCRGYPLTRLQNTARKRGNICIPGNPFFETSCLSFCLEDNFESIAKFVAYLHKEM